MHRLRRLNLMQRDRCTVAGVVRASSIPWSLVHTDNSAQAEILTFPSREWPVRLFMRLRGRQAHDGPSP